MIIRMTWQIQKLLLYSIVIHTIQGLVQDQTKYYYGEKRITFHRRHSKLLYIIFLHLRKEYKLGHIPRVTRDDRRHS